MWANRETARDMCVEREAALTADNSLLGDAIRERIYIFRRTDVRGKAFSRGPSFSLWFLRGAHSGA